MKLVVKSFLERTFFQCGESERERENAEDLEIRVVSGSAKVLCLGMG